MPYVWEVREDLRNGICRRATGGNKDHRSRTPTWLRLQPDSYPLIIRSVVLDKLILTGFSGQKAVSFSVASPSQTRIR